MSHYEVRPCRMSDGDRHEVEETDVDHAKFWGVYYRETLAMWVADFANEQDARDFAEMRNAEKT